MSISTKPHLILAEFDNPGQLLHAAEALRDAKFTRFDCHSPFPIHGMDQAMGLKRSPLGWMVGLVSLSGAALGLTLQGWTSTIDYPIIISGKPFFSYQAFVPVTFGLAVLFGALTSFFGMLILNRLPRLHHPVFYSERFSRVTDDGFFVSIEGTDPLFDVESVEKLLQSIGAKHIDVIDLLN